MTTHEITADARAIAVAQAIHRMADPEQTILFGSRARGDYRPDSDVDVLIIKDSPPTGGLAGGPARPGQGRCKKPSCRKRQEST